LTDAPSTAAIAALTFTLGAWVLDFMAAGQGIWARTLADLSPTAALKSFESGLFSLPSALGLLIAAATLTALAAIWLPPGRRPEAKIGLSAAAIAGALCLALLASKARLYADVTEDRRNSFSAPQEAALQHLISPLAVTIYLAPDDPRLVDFNRSILSKLRRLVTHLTVTIADTSKTLLGAASDDRYGLVTYDYGGKHEESRSTSSEEVLPLLYGLAGVSIAASGSETYPGYPLQADTSLAAVWFYGALPLLFATLWWRLLRPPALPANVNGREVSHDYRTKTNSS
jgi:hypothetical protein